LPFDAPTHGYEERRGYYEHQRLLTWIAVGLALVSIIGGVLYHLYYLRAGNTVTSLLPKDTVAYMRVISPDSVEESFHNLDLWQSSRPVRESMHAYERRIVSAMLLDIGINNALLQEFKKATHVMHLALLPAVQLSRRFPFDVVVFFEFQNHYIRDHLMGRIEPYFTGQGQDGGVDFFLKKTGASNYAMAAFERTLVVSWGSADVIRELLRRRDEGPSGSLNDVDGFRAAYEAGGHTAEFWSYFRADSLPRAALQQLRTATRGSPVAPWVEQLSHLFNIGDVEGIGFAVYSGHGEDHGRMRVYSSAAYSLKQLANQMGARPKRSLAVIPADAVLAVVTTVEKPAAFFESWRQSIVRLFGELNISQVLDLSVPAMNRFQAESGVVFSREVWPNLSKEIGVALLSREEDNSLGWLLVFQVQNVNRALKTVDKMLKHAFADRAGKFRRTRYDFSEDDEFHQIHRSDERKGVQGEWEQMGRVSVLCWSAVGRHLVFADDCDLVHRSRHAEALDETMDDNETLAATLKSLPQENTLLILARLPWIIAHYRKDWPMLKWVRSDFMLAAALTIHDDGLELVSNLSALPITFLAANPGVNAQSETNTEDPCKKLVASVCDNVQSIDLCEQWRAEVAQSQAQACQTGLRTMSSLTSDAVN
jgi:hypothetical protein